MFTDLVLPAGVYGTAFSGSNWNNGEKCGACMEITGPNGVTIKAMVSQPPFPIIPPPIHHTNTPFIQCTPREDFDLILREKKLLIIREKVVDQCPECDLGHLDIFADGFSQLAPTPGIINTSYRFTTCDISSPLVLHNKTGTSPYWFSIQVLNTSEPVANLEVSTDGGNTWLPTARQPYNFFENPAGFRTDRVMVKVTSETGKVVVVDGVGMDSDAKFTGPSNF